MLTTPQAQPAERRLSAVDLFCMETYQPAERDPLRRARGLALTLGLLCLILLASLGLSLWQGNAVERERDVLALQLRSERAAHARTALAAKDVEMNAANYVLETRVRRDIVDEQMLEAERRSNELEQRAQQVEQNKLARADCVTPRSILRAPNL